MRQQAPRNGGKGKGATLSHVLYAFSSKNNENRDWVEACVSLNRFAVVAVVAAIVAAVGGARGGSDEPQQHQLASWRGKGAGRCPSLLPRCFSRCQQQLVHHQQTLRVPAGTLGLDAGKRNGQQGQREPTTLAHMPPGCRCW